MSWLGKVLGGSVGYLIGGPLGAVAGAALGHGLDVMSEDDAAREQRPPAGGGPGLDPTEARKMAFFVSTFSLLGRLAKADGAVSREEIAVVERFMRDTLGLSPEARRFAVAVFNEAKSGATPIEAFATQFAELFRDQPEMRFNLVALLVEVALADGVLHPAEEQLIARVAGILGVPVGTYEQIKRARGDDLEREYAVLGASPEDSLATIKKKYRQLAQEHHPDRAIAQGLPEEFQAFANRRFQEIQAAYDKVREARGA